jgi:hypothetical protein
MILFLCEIIQFSDAEKKSGMAKFRRGKQLPKIPGLNLKICKKTPHAKENRCSLGPGGERNFFPRVKSAPRHGSKAQSLKRRPIIVSCCGKNSCHSGLVKKIKNRKPSNGTVKLANKGTEKVIAIILNNS